jgi:antirestriction protein ArdC
MNVYEIITNNIIEQLEKGTVPWQRPWKTGLPKNLVTKHEYRGVNVLVLGIQTYSCSYWATFKQIEKEGGIVKKGEKGTPIVYWAWNKNDAEENEREEKRRNKAPLLRYYKVFNLEQTEGIEIPKQENAYDGKPIQRCETVIEQMPNKPKIECNGGNEAFYRPATDSIHLPSKIAFILGEKYYATLFHEIVHSTGHPKRLNRTGISDTAMFGTEKYSKEELIAEIGAAFLCTLTGIDNNTVNNSAAYIASWLKVLKNDKRMVVLAAANAQKAVDYIRNDPTIKPD